MARISVLMPVYNAERYLRAALDSILAQTFRDFELIVVDDGSSDGSLRMLEQAAARDARVRLSSRPNRGLVATLNEMLALAKGELLARMDPDDVAEPERFAQQVQAFDADPALDLLGSNVHFIDPAGRRLMTFSYAHAHDAIDAWTMATERGSGMSHPSLMMRSAVVKRVGGYREAFWPAEDADLILRIAETGRLRNLVEPLLSYRLHPASTGSRLRSLQKQAHFRAIVDACARRGLPAPSEPVRALDEDAESEASRHTKWAWWALGSGNLPAGRALALSAIRAAPFSRAGWLVFACALRGH